MATDWPFLRLRDLCDSERGITYGIVQPGKDEQGGVPILRADNVEDGRLIVSNVMRVAPAVEASYGRSRLRGGEVLLTLVGAYFGKSAVVGEEHAGFNTARAVGVIPVRESAHFISYALRSPSCQVFIKERATTTAQPTLNLRDVEEIPIPWPPREVREKVTAVLRALDDKIELNRRMNETLEAMARAPFKSWFVDFDPVRAKAERRDPGLSKPLADLFPACLVESELGEVPVGWRIGTLGDIAEHPRRGVQPDQIQPNTPYIALEHMPKRCIALSDWGIAEGLESNKFAFETGEILFGKLRPYFHKVGVAPLDGVCSTDIVVVVPKSEDWFGLVLGHVSSDAFVAYTNAGSTGTKMPRTGWGDMARYAIVVPSKPIAEAFTDQVRTVVDRIISGIHESHTLAALRDTLLPNLISGELLVKDAEGIIARAV